ncbi:MAG: glycosyltransferase [Endomicrobiaceae bacterium]|nr:glycosyltransferase [Endomicrobiaceae bacterium]
MNPTITVLIISSNNRIDYLRKNINSLIKFGINIFVVVNGENSQIINFLTATMKNYSNIDFIILKEKINKSEARNIGVKNINSDYIYFLDDDTFIDKNNIQIINEKITKYPFLGVVGGPNLTPALSSKFQKLTGLLLSSYFMSYKMNARYFQKGKDRLTDDSELILCNLVIKKDLFIKYNLKFNKLLYYNEENLLLEHLKKHNVEMLYTPDLTVYHHRRKTLNSFLKQVYNSGKGRGIMSVMMPSSIKIFSIFPTLFILYLITVCFGKMTLVLLNVYLLLILFNTLTIFFTHKLKLSDITILFITTILSHLIYGCSFVTGILTGLLWKIKKVY